jgi:hypothetical protein
LVQSVVPGHPVRIAQRLHYVLLHKHRTFPTERFFLRPGTVEFLSVPLPVAVVAVVVPLLGKS